jgi:hypothetical protein
MDYRVGLFVTKVLDSGDGGAQCTLRQPVRHVGIPAERLLPLRCLIGQPGQVRRRRDGQSSGEAPCHGGGFVDVAEVFQRLPLCLLQQHGELGVVPFVQQHSTPSGPSGEGIRLVPVPRMGEGDLQDGGRTVVASHGKDDPDTTTYGRRRRCAVPPLQEFIHQARQGFEPDPAGITLAIDELSREVRRDVDHHGRIRPAAERMPG